MLRRVAPALVALAVAVAVAASYSSRRPSRRAQVRAATITWSDASSGRATGWIATDRKQALVGDGASWAARAYPATKMRVRSSGRGAVLELVDGALDVWAAPRDRREGLEVVAGQHRVRVVGTLFSVRRTGAAAAVWVAHGTVEVLRGTTLVATLHEGGWSAGGLPIPQLSPSDARWIEGRGTPRAPLREMPWPATEEDAGNESAAQRPVESHAAEVGPVPARTKQLASSSPASTPSRSRQPPGHEPSAPAADESSPTHGDVNAPQDPAGNAPRSGDEGTDDESATRLAMLLEREGRLDESVALYRRIAAGSGPAAEFALYRCGRVLAGRRGDPQGALGLWREQRIRFPNGTLRHEADLSILDVLVRLSRRSEALSEADAYLARWPASDRRRDVETIRARLSPRE